MTLFARKHVLVTLGDRLKVCAMAVTTTICTSNYLIIEIPGFVHFRILFNICYEAETIF